MRGLEPTCEPLTFEALCQLEPRLRPLYERAKAIRDHRRKPSFCANDVWYGRRGEDGFKDELQELVGWCRKDDPVLDTSSAYDIAYHKIYNTLPDCRNCACHVFHEIITSRLASQHARHRKSK